MRNFDNKIESILSKVDGNRFSNRDSKLSGNIDTNNRQSSIDNRSIDKGKGSKDKRRSTKDKGRSSNNEIRVSSINIRRSSLERQVPNYGNDEIARMDEKIQEIWKILESNGSRDTLSVERKQTHRDK